MRFAAISVLLVLLSGCTQGQYVTKEEFAAYKADNLTMLYKMAQLHALAAEVSKDHSERLNTLEAHHNVRTY